MIPAPQGKSNVTKINDGKLWKTLAEIKPAIFPISLNVFHPLKKQTQKTDHIYALHQ